ncbi:hypothetical protein H2200_005751 [Cladophialophora chaetospira]|uniref:Uncharacterized protein n=1 Tax=Cladophialophora chaetospira TaxID=386627 RepID=A0AA38X9N0_9EURO|nr:hypothetical protein H2200_005751 [Cladophialophora chaetospira]
MAPWIQLAALPSSLLFLISISISPASSQNLNLRWPYNLPPDSKYYPEDELLIKRDIDVQHKLQRISPTGVRKLSGDEGEKFYMDYWGFEEEQEREWNTYSTWGNTTMWTTFEQPVRDTISSRSALSSALQERPLALPSTGLTAAVLQDLLAKSSKNPAILRATWVAVPMGRLAAMHSRLPAQVVIHLVPITREEDVACLDTHAMTLAVYRRQQPQYQSLRLGRVPRL